MAVKKVAMLVFNPFTNDSRVLKEALSLQNNGYDVRVVAHGDKHLKSKQIIQGIKVVRLAYLDRQQTQSKIGKLKAYLSYIRQTVNYAKDFEIVHCNDLNALPIGFIIKKLYNPKIKIIYDAHEYETEVNGLHGIQKSLTKLFEKFLIRYADQMITVGGCIADEYARLYDIARPALVLNTPHFKAIEKKNIFREELGIREDQDIYLYQGRLGKGRGVEILIEAFRQLSSDKSVIVFMGYGALEETIKQSAKSHNTIYFYPAVPPNVLLDYTCSADFGISTIENSCLNYYYCLPNKMFEFIMAEIPMIVSDLPEMRKIVEEYKIGVVAVQNTPNGLINAISRLEAMDKKQMHANIQKAKAVLNWEEQEKVLLKSYQALYAKQG